MATARLSSPKPAQKWAKLAPKQGTRVSDYQGTRFADQGYTSPLDARRAPQQSAAPRESSPDPSRTGRARIENQDKFAPLETPQAQDNLQKRKSLTGFDWYIKTAQVYLKRGRYYRAADAYTLASIYKPDPPEVGLAYAGKSHALFAAGEYISSTLFLSKALDVMPEYARFRVDLVDIVGDQNKLEKRIADAEERFQISGAAELQFLLGYVYYQSFLRSSTTKDEIDRLGAAKKAIDAAYDKIRSAKADEIRNSAARLRQAVGAVKRAIDEALFGSPTASGAKKTAPSSARFRGGKPAPTTAGAS